MHACRPFTIPEVGSLSHEDSLGYSNKKKKEGKGKFFIGSYANAPRRKNATMDSKFLFVVRDIGPREGLMNVP